MSYHKRPQLNLDIEAHNARIFQANKWRLDLQEKINGTLWKKYISLGPASRCLNGTILLYHAPNQHFWDLYYKSKGLFRNLGIYVRKVGDSWIAHIPLSVLNNADFHNSGLIHHHQQ